MKIKSLLIGMLASTAFVACTNDESPVNNEQAVAGGEKQYVAVNIVTPNSVGSRATFEAGLPDEVKVKDAIFLFLDGNYNGCAEPYYTTNFTWDGDATGEGQDKKKTVLVVEGKKDEVPAYILAILNPINKDQFTANTSLQNVKDFYAQFANSTDYLVMSNAVYADNNGKEVAATPITLDNIVTDKEDIEDESYNPVTIQVERVVGKVIVNKLADAIADLNANGLKETIDDQENLKLKFVLTGWEVLQNKGSYQIKNIDATNWTISNWNDATLKRTYWANDFTSKGRTSYDVTKMTNTAFKYVEETVNQVPQAKDHKDMVSPYVLVSGYFADEEGEAVDLVEWRGQKYTKAGYLNFIAGNPEISKYYTAVTEGDKTTYTSFSADLLKLQDNKENDWGATAVLKDKNTEFYTVTFKADGKTIENATKVTVAEGETNPVANAIASFGEVLYWNGGNAYYYTPILHQTDETENGKNNYYGVVRNHAYNINITKIQGYGTPVAEPNQLIDQPEKPNEGSTFIAADIVVLDWRVISNNVTLGE